METIQGTKAERLAEYNKRAEKWLPLMQDVRPLQEAFGKLPYSCRKGTPEYEAYNTARRKLDAARRANILAMVRTAFPGLVVSLTKNNGWGSTYKIEWTDGPTKEEFLRATDLDLFCRAYDTFDGMTDCAGVGYMEFTTFAEYAMNDRHGDIETNRIHGEAYTMCKDVIRETLPELKESTERDPILTDSQILVLRRELGKSNPILLNKSIGSHGNWLSSVATRIWWEISFYTPQPAQNTDNTADEAPADGLTIVDIAGGVAVVGSSRDTFRSRKQIKAHGATWNKDAQQWQATTPENVATLRAWFNA